jgi:hypothetical protein
MMSSGTLVTAATRAAELRLGELLQQDMRLAIEDAVALLNDGEADRLRQVALARAGRAEEERVGGLSDPAGGGQLEHEGPVHLPVEIEVEGVEPLADIAKSGALQPAFEEPILPAEQFVLHEPGQEIDRREFSACASSKRASRAAAIPEQRSWRRTRCSSTTFMA